MRIHRTGLLAGILTASLCAAQSQKPQEFEVASVRPNLSSLEQDGGINISGSRISGTNLSLRMLILQAYGILDFQLAGGPNWLASDRYDIQASTGRDETITQSELGPLLRSLLADRFHLALHPETRERQSHAWVVDKGGPKIQEAVGVPAQSMSGVNQRATAGTAKMIGSGVPMSALAYRLAVQQPFRGNVVVDKKGLAGFYDFTLEWEPGDDAGSSILTGLREQLGLRLVSEKSSVQVLVIDSAEKPSAN
jgi:uncharacterized protein (TIGR03435 family)